MAIRYLDSAEKHGIEQADAVHAMLNYEGTETRRDDSGREIRVFVGHPHPQTDRYIEVIATMHRGDVVIFHAMPLSDLYRHLLAP